MEKKEINYQFKFLYAIGMILIVAGHCKNGGISLAYEWFTPYAFHLGLFAFASGYFYKDSSEDNLKAYIWKKTKRLLIPMYLFHWLYAIIGQLLSLKGFTIGGEVNLYTLLIAPLIDGHQFGFTMGLWFVVPLWMIEVGNAIFRKLIKKKIKQPNEYVLCIFYFLLGLLGVFLGYRGYREGALLAIVRMLYLLPFYGLGILYQRKLEKRDNISNIWYFSVIFIAQLTIITIYGKTIRFTPSWCNDFTENIVLPYIVGILGIGFWLRIAKILEPIIKNSKCINVIADHTYPIMVHQFLGFFIVNTSFAICSKLLPICQDFNWLEFKNNIFYFYLPRGIQQWYIVYLIAGIIVPILISWIGIKVKEKIQQVWKKRKMLLIK